VLGRLNLSSYRTKPMPLIPSSSKGAAGLLSEVKRATPAGEVIAHSDVCQSTGRKGDSSIDLVVSSRGRPDKRGRFGSGAIGE